MVSTVGLRVFTCHWINFQDNIISSLLKSPTLGGAIYLMAIYPPNGVSNMIIMFDAKNSSHSPTLEPAGLYACWEFSGLIFLKLMKGKKQSDPWTQSHQPTTSMSPTATNGDGTPPHATGSSSCWWYRHIYGQHPRRSEVQNWLHVWKSSILSSNKLAKDLFLSKLYKPWQHTLPPPPCFLIGPSPISHITQPTSNYGNAEFYPSHPSNSDPSAPFSLLTAPILVALHAPPSLGGLVVFGWPECWQRPLEISLAPDHL
jgi:hypothetical protein